MSTEESDAYELTCKEEAAQKREEAAIEAWISGQLLTPIESFRWNAIQKELTRLEIVIGNILICHDAKTSPEIMRTKVSQLRDLLRAPLDRYCSVPFNRARIIREWDQE